MLNYNKSISGHLHFVHNINNRQSSILIHQVNERTHNIEKCNESFINTINIARYSNNKCNDFLNDAICSA